MAVLPAVGGLLIAFAAYAGNQTAPASSNTPRPPRNTGERGALWTGTITGHHFGTVDGTTSEQTFTVKVRLREYKFPLHCPAKQAGTFIKLESEGSDVTTSFTSSSPYGSCSGEGSGTFTTSPGSQVTGSGGIWKKNVDRDFTPCVGVDFARGSSIYLVSINSPAGLAYTVRCSNGSAWEAQFVPPVVGWFPSYGNSLCSDSKTRVLEDGGRMRGTYSGKCIGAFPNTEFSWSICREGVECSPPPSGSGTPPGTEPRRPCDETAPDRAQLDVLLNQWKLYAQELKQSTAEFELLQRDAANLVNDFEHAMRDCNLWGIAQILVGLLTSGLTAEGQVAADQQVFNSFINYTGQLEKIASGDPSWLLPTANTEVRGTEWLSVENYWDMFNNAYSNLGDSAPQQLIDRLRNCGAPTYEGVLDGAYEYLHLMEKIKPVADRMHERANRLHQHEDKILDFCRSHPKACEDYEPCRNRN